MKQQTTADKKLIAFTIAGILFVSILGTLAHFIYEWSDYHTLVGLFTPVNESIWEHMKLLFFPMLLYLVFEFLLLRKDYPKIFGSGSIGIVAGALAIPLTFYIYSGILGKHSLVMDILTFFIAVILSFFLQFRGITTEKYKKYTTAAMIAAMVLFVCFLMFTYFPPELGLFQVP